MREHLPTTPQQLMRRFLACSLVGLALLLAACGGSESESQDSSSADATAQEQELQERADELERREEAAAERERKAREREREARQAERAARRKERAEADAPPRDSSGSGGGGITVPNVVGLDHQAAQDALQGEGLYNLDERDCTGQGRALLFDRNWEVVSTDPPAGAAVSEDDKITLCSVKQGEQ